MYIRFESRRRHAGWDCGLFAQMYRLRDELRLWEDASRGTRRALRPPRLTRAERREFDHVFHTLHTMPSPRHDYSDPHARYPRTWFKPEARELIAAAWRMCELLNKSGRSMRPLVSYNPGVVLFEDEVQVVVRPHDRSLPAARRHGRAREDRAWDGDRTTIRRWDRRAARRCGMG